MHLGERIVQGLAIPERFVDRRVESIQDAELELVWAFEEIFQIGERKNEIGHPGARRRRKPLTRRVVLDTAFYMLRNQNSIPEFRSSYVSIVFASNRCPCQMQKFLTSCHRNIKQSPFVFDRAFIS